MITQNALLLDQMSDATKLMENLSKLSYAPRLPESYLVPEGITVDAEAGVIRRQGDLGNLVQLAEAAEVLCDYDGGFARQQQNAENHAAAPGSLESRYSGFCAAKCRRSRRPARFLSEGRRSDGANYA